MKIGPAMTKWDWTLIAALVAACALGWAYGLTHAREPEVVQAYSGSTLFAELPADRDAVVRVPGPLGESVVEVRSGGVSMISSPCPDKLCMGMGRISSSGEGILCIPNRVSVTLKSGSGRMDAVTY